MESSQQPSEARGTNSSLARKLLIAFVVVCVVGWVFRSFWWSVIKAMMMNVVPILFTPVILELSVCFVGLFIVLMFNHLRRKEQEDEWVYISQVEPEDEMESIPEPLRKRVGETVLKSKPPAADLDELPLESIEGLLELGMLEEADKELSKASAADEKRPAFVRLRLMRLLKGQQWSEAQSYSNARPAPPDAMAKCCVEVASFFVGQKPSDKEAARKCLDLGKSLSVNAVVEAIDADRRLQKLA